MQTPGVLFWLLQFKAFVFVVAQSALLSIRIVLNQLIWSDYSSLFCKLSFLLKTISFVSLNFECLICVALSSTQPMARTIINSYLWILTLISYWKKKIRKFPARNYIQFDVVLLLLDVAILHKQILIHLAINRKSFVPSLLYNLIDFQHQDTYLESINK